MKPERWQQVEQLYHSTMEREADQRAAFLNEACAGDDSLRREVESLLAHATPAESLLETPALEVAAKALNSGQSDAVVGQRLGPYQILALLGAGGMGEVYRARDTRLGREVAIKVLPAEYAANADRLRRFEQEARAAGLLNHPNVLTLYDIGTAAQEAGGAPYLVMELLEGATLRERLRGEGLPLRRVVDYALQIARGLQAAHAKGIVHRDLKPENLFVTKDGRVKILDFGLAKLKPPPASVDSQAPTQPLPTAPGMVLGTVGYMSPEQVRAEEVDQRADIFAYGAILYEMLAGQRAFQGKSAVEIMNAILQAEPPELATTGRDIPPMLERVMRHCLEKNAEDRFQAMSDVAFNLDGLFSHAGAATPSQALAPPRARNWARYAWVVPSMLLLAALAFAVAYFRRIPAELKNIRFSISPPEKAAIGDFAVSPDGNQLAFTATNSEGKTLLWIRSLNSLNPQSLPGTEGAAVPFWSPDGRFIAFFAQDKLKKIEVAGGPPQMICTADVINGGAWNRDGVILMALTPFSALQRVPATGGEPIPVTKLDASRQEIAHYWPQFLPDGRHFLYWVRDPQPEHRGTYVGSLDGQEPKRLLSNDSIAVYAPPGYLLFVREGVLLAQPFDAERLQLSGDPAPIAEQVGYSLNYGRVSFSVSPSGVLVYRSSAPATRSESRLRWFDRKGNLLGSVGEPAAYMYPNLSPDEKRIAIEIADPKTAAHGLWLLDLARGVPSRFTFDPSGNHFPTWSPDGSRIVFGSERGGPWNLYQRAANGAGNEELLLKSNFTIRSTDWSSDGRFVIYDLSDPKTKTDLWVLPMTGERTPMLFLQTKFEEAQGCFSPDTKWVAYTSNESGRDEVYVRAFPPAGGQWQVSTGGGGQPRFRRDGKELFYLAADKKLMAVEVKEGSTFESGAPKTLFQTQISNLRGVYGYAVTADGKRFLVIAPVGDTVAPTLTVVLNWTAELKR